MAGTTWDVIFPGRTDYVRKMLFGSVLVQDYSTTNTFSTYSPFDNSDGNLATTLLTTDGWIDIGYIDETSVEFTPNYKVTDVQAWQTRQKIRSDADADTESAKITAIQSSAVVDALYRNVAISSLTTGSTGYKITKPLVPNLIYRSVLFLGVDGSGSNLQYMARLYPKALMTKPDKQDFGAKKEMQYPMTFEPYPDPVAGYAVKDFREGPGWRAFAVPLAPTGLTAGTTTTTSIALSWTAPSSVLGPAATTYTVSATFRSNGAAVSGATFTPNNPNSTTAVTVGGLTTGTTYVFKVVANNAAGAGGSATVTAATS